MTKSLASPREHRASRNRCTECATRMHCFVGSVPKAAAVIGPLVRERSSQQGEMIARQGDRDSVFKVIKIGTVVVCRNDAGGVPRPVGFATRGTVFGIVSYMGQPNMLSVVAASSARYCEIAADTVRLLERDDEAVRQGLGKVYMDNMLTAVKWTAVVGRKGVVSQVAGVLELLAEQESSTSISIPTHTAMAQLIGTTRESVARALTTLEKSGGLQKISQRRCSIHPQLLSQWESK
jgi:CRP-like cAMP-binding protein